MKRPPEFIDVTADNLAEITNRARREPHIRNGLMCAPSEGPDIAEFDTVAFPWPDTITELGLLYEDAQKELEGEPIPAWPISRLRLQKGDILIVRVGLPGSMSPVDAYTYMERCRDVMRRSLDAAGHKEVQVLALHDSIGISVIAGSDGMEEA